MDAGELRRRAERCRRLASEIPDRPEAKTMLQMADQLEAEASRLEAEGRDQASDG